MERMFRSKVVFFFPLVITVVSIPILLFLFWQQSHFGEAMYFNKLAKRFPAGSIEAKRFRAIANALWHGKITYVFTTNKLPAQK